MPFHVSVGIRGRAGRTPFTFAGREINVGRAPDNDLVLAHESVAEHHAVLAVQRGTFVVLDRGSRGGTWIGTERVHERGVEPTDAIIVGPYEIEVHEREPPGEVERGFLTAIEDRPSDDDTRAVYADWLEEQGRQREADFVRAQLQVKTMNPGGAAFQRLSALIREVGPTLPMAWRRAVAHMPIENCDRSGLRFELVCPQRWDGLTKTETPNERYCGACEKRVHFAPTIDKARRLAVLGHCVAVDLTVQPRHEGDLAPRPTRMLAGVIMS